MSRPRVATRSFAFAAFVAVPVAFPSLVAGQTPGDPGAVAAVPAYEIRQALLESAPWVPSVPVPLDDATRTVFYNPRLVEGQLTQVVVQPPEVLTAVPDAIFRIASWLVPRGDLSDRLGDLVGPAGAQASGGNRTLHIHEEVRLDFVVEGSPRPGDVFQLYRTDREIPGVGDVLVPTGRVEITVIDGERALGRIVEEYAPIEVGNHVGRVPAFLLQPGMHPQPSNLAIGATLIAFEEVRELYLPGQMGFLDRGRPAGIAVGDEFTSYSGTGGGFTARFQVVSVSETSSTVRVIEVRAPRLVRPGLQVVLDRKMP